MASTRFLLLFCVFLLVPAVRSQSSGPPPASTPTPAQSQAPPVTTIPVEVKVVTLPVTVRDKKGKIVRDLTKEDFDLQEDGKPQTIRYFSQETNLPLTVGLLVDTSMSERDNIDRERTASKSFLDQMINRPVDRAFVIHFDREIELLQDLTSDHAKLEKAVSLIDTESQVESVQQTSDQDQGSHRAHRAGGTALYDAIFLACDEVTKKITGRKAIVLLTDGEDRGSKETLSEAIESAQRAETVVYAIYIGGHEDHDYQPNQGMGRRGGGYPGRYPGGGYPGGGYPGGNYPRQQENRPDGKKILQRIAQETGGRYFEAKKKDSVDDIYAQIAEELRTQFMLGYTPPKDQPSGYHSIHLLAKKKDLTVQTREGYYSGQ
ncbi:MAG: VWA domain-containing protein [Acidobacteriaceae bacterium]